MFQAGADVNIVNNVGDTPLHQAAFTGRKVSQVIGAVRFLPFCGIKYDTHL